jgi:hypothetical protein
MHRLTICAESVANSRCLGQRIATVKNEARAAQAGYPIGPRSSAWDPKTDVVIAAAESSSPARVLKLSIRDSCSERARAASSYATSQRAASSAIVSGTPSSRRRTSSETEGVGHLEPPARAVAFSGLVKFPMATSAVPDSGRSAGELTIGPASDFCSGRRPARITMCLLPLKGLQKRHARIAGCDLHPCSPPPVSQARRPPRPKRMLRNFLALGVQLALIIPEQGRRLMLRHI